MSVNTDFQDLLRAFNDHGIRYLIVGAYAVMYYTEPRFTKDLDIWVEPSLENARKVWAALAEFGAPLEQVTLNDFLNKELVYQIGIAPNRVDIMMGIKGVHFQTAWESRVISSYEKIPVNIIGLNDLIRAKKKAGRDQDRIDLKRLLSVQG